jgi:hypothetical protein
MMLPVSRGPLFDTASESREGSNALETKLNYTNPVFRVSLLTESGENERKVLQASDTPTHPADVFINEA